MKLDGVELQINLMEYLEQHSLQYRMNGDDAMMCCPFHAESRPSFGINTDSGLYHCFGCGAKGNFASFIKRIEGLASYEAARALAYSRYALYYNDDGVPPPRLDFVPAGPHQHAYISDQDLKQYDYRHPYLETRGISELWQSRFRVGYDRASQAITIPWFDRHGRCVGIKFRSVAAKRFWMQRPTPDSPAPNDLTLFGLNHIYRRRDEVAVITEAEIDALYAWQILPTIAVGTSSISEGQLRELKHTNLTTIIIAADNDDPGRKLANSLRQKLTWIPNLLCVDWARYAPDKKDLNSLATDSLSKLLKNAQIFVDKYCCH